VCGKEIFERKQSYCSPECRYKAQIERQRNRYEKEYKSTQTEAEEKQKKKRGRPRKRLSIADINQLAREEGLNYGQYVAKYGL
jgi:ribosomal protein L20